MFYIKTKDLDERTRLIDYLKSKEIMAVFHYIPLHSSPAGKKFGKFFGIDKYTTKESERLLRLPMYYNLNSSDVNRVIASYMNFIHLMKMRQAVYTT
jgi:dTDP-4-amino-4,6-dideoxygalactose transaminase